MASSSASDRPDASNTASKRSPTFSAPSSIAAFRARMSFCTSSEELPPTSRTCFSMEFTFMYALALRGLPRASKPLSELYYSYPSTPPQASKVGRRDASVGFRTSTGFQGHSTLPWASVFSSVGASKVGRCNASVGFHTSMGFQGHNSTPPWAPSGESERAIALRLLEPKSTVHDIISRFKKPNSIEEKPRRSRARPVRTRQLVEKVRKKLKRSAHRSLAEMSKEYNVSRTSLQRVIKYDLHAKCFKFQQRQVISEATVVKRLQRGRTAAEIIATTNYARRTVYSVFNAFKATGKSSRAVHKPRSDRKRTARFIAGLNRVLDAFLYDVTVLNHWAAQDDDCKLLTVGAWYAKTGYGIGFPRNSKHFQSINNRIVEYEENGDLERLRRFWFTGTCRSHEGGEKSTEPLAPEQFLSSFVLLGSGIVLAFGILLFDLIKGLEFHGTPSIKHHCGLVGQENKDSAMDKSETALKKSRMAIMNTCQSTKCNRDKYRLFIELDCLRRRQRFLGNRLGGLESVKKSKKGA
eukprot:maker-scaffold852_size88784-snap-gene-0.15 protein:Tk07247 transcript:maker-scaffold852_size88784-snap-gene-0.15-mRNA-1 annotation:"Glutamate"